MIRESKEQSYYEVLDVSMNANYETIRTAYIRAKNAYNRDSIAAYTLFDQDESRKILDQIEEAYTVLSDAEKRKIYDDAHGYMSSDGLSTSTATKLKPIDMPNVALGISREIMQNTSAAPNTTPDTSMSHIDRLKSLQTASASYTPLRSYSVAATYEKNEAMEEKMKNPSEVNGSFLKEVREYKRVSPERMMDILKLKKIYLIALEEDDVSKLPAAVFVRGFVFQYAKALQLDGEKIASSYMNFFRLKRPN